jgi:hypothetical protein
MFTPVLKYEIEFTTWQDSQHYDPKANLKTFAEIGSAPIHKSPEAVLFASVLKNLHGLCALPGCIYYNIIGRSSAASANIHLKQGYVKRVAENGGVKIYSSVIAFLIRAL